MSEPPLWTVMAGFFPPSFVMQTSPNQTVDCLIELDFLCTVRAAGASHDLTMYGTFMQRGMCWKRVHLTEKCFSRVLRLCIRGSLRRYTELRIQLDCVGGTLLWCGRIETCIPRRPGYIICGWAGSCVFKVRILVASSNGRRRVWCARRGITAKDGKYRNWKRNWGLCLKNVEDSTASACERLNFTPGGVYMCICVRCAHSLRKELQLIPFKINKWIKFKWRYFLCQLETATDYDERSKLRRALRRAKESQGKEVGSRKKVGSTVYRRAGFQAPKVMTIPNSVTGNVLPNKVNMENPTTVIPPSTTAIISFLAKNPQASPSRTSVRSEGRVSASPTPNVRCP